MGKNYPANLNEFKFTPIHFTLVFCRESTRRSEYSEHMYAHWLYIRNMIKGASFELCYDTAIISHWSHSYENTEHDQLSWTVGENFS